MASNVKQNSLSIILVAGLVALALALWDTDPSSLIPKAFDTQTEHFPYAKLQDARTQHFDQSGQLSYEFFSREMLHYRKNANLTQEDDFTTMTQPELTLYTEGQPWRVLAKNGRITEFGAKLTLSGEVTIWQTQDNGDTTKLITERLVLYPQSKRIDTEQAVEIRSPLGTMTAIGMEVNLETRNIKLLEQVRGHYEPI